MRGVRERNEISVRTVLPRQHTTHEMRTNFIHILAPILFPCSFQFLYIYFEIVFGYLGEV